MVTRIGIIGPGGIADDQHAPALSSLEDVVLWSVLSRSHDRAERFADRHGALSPQPCYTELGAMLSDPDLDAVIVTTPDRQHSEHAMQAMLAGKHVLVEKPMATTIDEGLAMIRVAEETGRCLAVAYHLRWHAGHRVVRKRLLKGELGSLRHMRVHWTFKAPDATNWRANPETGQWWSLAANGTHCLDLIRWMMKSDCGEILSVRVHTSHSVWDTPHDETAIVALGFESGATAEICTSVLFDSPSRVEIYGSEGYAVLDDTMGRHGGGSIVFAGAPLKYDFTCPFSGEIMDFVRAIRTAGVPEVDGKEGMANIEILMSTVQSDATAG